MDTFSLEPVQGDRAGSGRWAPRGAHGGRVLSPPYSFLAWVRGFPGPRPTQPEGWGPHHADGVPFPGQDHLPLRPLCVAGSSGEARKESPDWRHPKHGEESIHESRGLLHPTSPQHRSVEVGKVEKGAMNHCTEKSGKEASQARALTSGPASGLPTRMSGKSPSALTEPLERPSGTALGRVELSVTPSVPVKSFRGRCQMNSLSKVTRLSP